MNFDKFRLEGIRIAQFIFILVTLTPPLVSVNKLLLVSGLANVYELRTSVFVAHKNLGLRYSVSRTSCFDSKMNRDDFLGVQLDRHRRRKYESVAARQFAHFGGFLLDLRSSDPRIRCFNRHDR